MAGGAIKNYAIYCPNGQFAGLRTNTTVFCDQYTQKTLTWSDHHVLIAPYGSRKHMTLVIENDMDGAEYIIESRIEKVYLRTVSPIYSYPLGAYFIATEASVDNVREGTTDDYLVLSRGVWKLKKYSMYTGKSDSGEWTLCPIYIQS